MILKLTSKIAYCNIHILKFIDKKKNQIYINWFVWSHKYMHLKDSIMVNLLKYTHYIIFM